MATKKDPQLKEDVTRGAENEHGSAGIDNRNNNNNEEEVSNESDTIKNASATGLGTLGRNDEQQKGHTSNHSADGGNG